MRRTLSTGLALSALALSPLSAQAQYAQSAPPAQVSGNPLTSIFGCAAGGNRQAGGAVIGGLLGGVVGNRAARNEQTIGTGAGAALGAALGSYLGCRMQVADQQRAYAAAQAALAQGQSQSWNNAQTGVSGSTNIISTSGGGYGQTQYGQPAQTGYAPQPQPLSLAGLRVASNVQLQTSLESAPATRYMSPGSVNLRAGPSTSTPVVGKLKAGERVDGLARVQGQSWILVGRGGTGIGYVSESVIRAEGAPVQTYAGAQSGGYAQASTPAQPLCRVIEQTVNTPGAQPVVERYRACQQADGQWAVTAA